MSQWNTILEGYFPIYIKPGGLKTFAGGKKNVGKKKKENGHNYSKNKKFYTTSYVCNECRLNVVDQSC